MNHYERLTNYLEDGRYEPDNGYVERVIKKFAVRRRNWLFSTSVEGAEASSVLYSLAVTAKQNGKDPYETMLKILNDMPAARTIDDYEKLAQLLVKRSSLR